MKYYDSLYWKLRFRGNRKDGLSSLYCSGQLEDINTEGVYVETCVTMNHPRHQFAQGSKMHMTAPDV